MSQGSVVVYKKLKEAYAKLEADLVATKAVLREYHQASLAKQEAFIKLEAERDALKATLQTWKNHAAVEEAENAQLRELAGEAAAIIKARGGDEEMDEEGDAWLAKARALGVWAK